jgi:hypothetical protein
MIMSEMTYAMSGADTEVAVMQYTETALWSETDDNGEPLDDNYDESDIDAHSRQRMATDMRTFIASCELERPGVFTGMDPGQVGHDFWLTRNRHGAGFWDRGLGAVGSWLTEQSHDHGEAHLTVTDDGTLYYT